MLPVLSLLTLAIPLVAADVDFTTPGPGVEVPYGEINVAWKQNGKAPFLADLTQYTLNLMTGGNEEDNMVGHLALKGRKGKQREREEELMHAVGMDNMLTWFHRVATYSNVRLSGGLCDRQSCVWCCFFWHCSHREERLVRHIRAIDAAIDLR